MTSFMWKVKNGILLLTLLSFKNLNYAFCSSSPVSRKQAFKSSAQKYSRFLLSTLGASALPYTSFAQTGSNMEEEKIVLVTGSTDGIGKHTAIKLAQNGMKILLHGRNANKLDKTYDDIMKIHPTAKLQKYHYDVSSIKSIKAFASAIRNDHTQLHVLINNAGIYTEQYTLTEDNLESTFAINVMAPFLLSILLYPLLKSTEKSRILNVSSTSQDEGNPVIDLNNLQYQLGRYEGHESYCLSKLCLAAISNEYARRVTPNDVLVYSCDPGDVNTQMLKAGWPGYNGVEIEDADDEYKLVTRPYDSNMHGKYYWQCRETRCNPQVYNTSLRNCLWKELERITGITNFPSNIV